MPVRLELSHLNPLNGFGQVFIHELVAAFDNARRGSRHSAVRGNVPHHDKTVGADFDIIPDVDRPEQNRTGPDKHVTAYGRVTLAGMLSRSTKRDIVEQDAVVPNFCRLANYDADSVVDEHPFADLCPGMNL